MSLPWCSDSILFLFDATFILDTFSRDADWNQTDPLCTPPRGWTVRPLATRHPATGYVPNFCVDVSSEHTPINFPSRKDSFNLENELTNTVAASEDFDHLLNDS